MAMARFASTNETEAAEIRGNRLSKDTLKANRSAALVLEGYLREKGFSPNFESLSRSQLKAFYLDVRKTDGTLYKTGSMKCMRHSLNRYLNSVPYERGIDLVKDPEFRESNLNFDSMIAKLKQEGLGETVHYPAICDGDIKTHRCFCQQKRRLGCTTKCSLTYDCIFFAVVLKTCTKCPS